MTTAYEVNFDGLIGPSHNYGGMSEGNLASARNEGAASNPREAALQGLEKMRILVNAGLKQGFLPPLQRPNFDFLLRSGFNGTNTEIIKCAAQTAPGLLKAAAHEDGAEPNNDGEPGPIVQLLGEWGGGTLAERKKQQNGWASGGHLVGFWWASCEV